MARQTIPPKLALTLSALIVALTAWLWMQSSRDHKPTAQETERDPKPTAATDSPELHSASDLADHLENGQTNSSHAISDERILTFASDTDYRRFLANIPDGMELVSQNDTLRSLRIRGSSSFDLRALAPGAQEEENFTLLTPMPIVTDTLAQDRAFGGSALSLINGLLLSDSAGRGVKVAVLDTGIRNHATLNPDRITQTNTTTPQDFLSHGTAVASLIAGKDVGIAPQADLLGIQVLDTDGIGDVYSLATAIVEAVDSGANIINMSLGSYGTNQALANAIDYANAKAVVLVASAGNESVATLPFPAAYESVIAVSAIDAAGHPTSFSNQSASIDIAAPGVGVYAAWDDEKWISFTGTSAAAPYVSGAIAALSSELEIPATEAAQILLANANDSGFPGPDSQIGLGYIDIRRSLESNTRYTDLALADIYLSPAQDERDQYSIYLTAQNRGTTRIPAATLDYTLPNGITQSVYLGSLEPGQSAGKVLRISESALASGYELSAQVSAGNYAPDSHADNDSRQTVLEVPSEEAEP